MTLASVGPGGLPPSIAVAIPVTTTDQEVQGRGGIVTGWSFKETTGAATAEVWIVNGNNATGVPIAFITLLANQSVRDVLADNGVLCDLGLFVHVVSGSVQGSVWSVQT